MPAKRRTGELTPKTSQTQLELSDRDAAFLRFTRRVKWGTLMVKIHNGEPLVWRVLIRDYRSDTPLPDDIEIFVSEATRDLWKSA